MDLRRRTDMGLRGDLQIETFDRAGRRRTRYAIKNQITVDGVKSHLKLLAQKTGTTLADWRFAKLIVGTGTTPTSPGDTGLASPVPALDGGEKVLDPDVDITEDDATGELVVEVTFELGSAGTEANGYRLTEAAIVLGNGRCYARQVNPGIDKTSAFRVKYTWRFAHTI